MPRRKTDNQFPRYSGEQFGMRMRKIRLSKGISVKTMASKIGVLETYIPQLERGEKLPSFDTLIYIANALGVTTDQLLCDYLAADNGTIPTEIKKKMAKLSKSQQQHLEILVDLETQYMLEDKDS